MEKKNWGSLPPIDDAAQVTRAMLDMKKAKPFPISHSEIAIEEVNSQPIASKSCCYAINNAKLIEYINDGEAYIAETNSSNVVQMPVYPSLDPLPGLAVSKQNSTKSQKVMTFYPHNFEDVDDSLKQGIALTAVSLGFSLATSTALDLLTDITHSHVDTLCQSLSAVLDVEAKTGKTAFFDSVDQVLHDMDIGNINDLENFYKQSVIKNYEKLKTKSETLQADIQIAGNKNLKAQAKVKQENQFRSGWVPVTNIVNETASFSQNPRWKPFVKTEPQHVQQQTTQTTNLYGNVNFQEPANVDSSSEYWPSQKRFCQ